VPSNPHCHRGFLPPGPIFWTHASGTQKFPRRPLGGRLTRVPACPCRVPHRPSRDLVARAGRPLSSPLSGGLPTAVAVAGRDGTCGRRGCAGCRLPVALSGVMVTAGPVVAPGGDWGWRGCRPVCQRAAPPPPGGPPRPKIPRGHAAAGQGRYIYYCTLLRANLQGEKPGQRQFAPPGARPPAEGGWPGLSTMVCSGPIHRAQTARTA
jgi:hypothetical protein